MAASAAEKRTAEIVDMASLIAGEGKKAERRTKVAPDLSDLAEAEASLEELLNAADQLDAMLKGADGKPPQKRSAQKRGPQAASARKPSQPRRQPR